MAVTIDWKTRVIYVPRDDLTLRQSVPFEIREMDLNWFRIQLKNLEDSEVGMAYPDTHRHNTTVTVGGFTLARVIEIINDFTITFEDGQYAVNLVGANSNVGDKVNVNQVSVRSSNSAGMIVVSGSGGGTDEATIHSALNSYVNKNLYKADVSNLATAANLDIVNNNVLNIDSDISTVQSSINTVNTKVDNIQSDIDTIDSTINDISVDVAAIGIDVDDIDSRTSLIQTATGTINSKIDIIDTNIDNMSTALSDVPTTSENANAVWQHATATQLLLNVAFIKDIEGGKWAIVNNQMIFYKSDNSTEVARFNLYNSSNAPSSENVTRRERV